MALALPKPTARERVFAAGSVFVTQELKDGVFQVPEIRLALEDVPGKFGGFKAAREWAREIGRAADLAEVWDVNTGQTLEQAEVDLVTTEGGA